MTIDAALTDFREAAIAKVDAATPAEDHKFHKIMSRSIHFLKMQGELGRLALRQLLSDENEHVRVWVAAEVLSEGDKTVLPVLQQIAQTSSPLGFNAEMTIREFEAGRLKSPFPSNVN